MKIELIIRCDECGNKLNISCRESDSNIIFVSPGQYEAIEDE